MAHAYLLDTNILIAALKGHPQVRQRLEEVPLTSLWLSSIVLGELESGAAKSAQGERNRARLAALTQRLPLLGTERETCLRYAEVRAHLEAQGTPIGANDTWIAAQALACDAVLVTDNEREFARVPGLVIENWLRQG